MSSVDSEKSTVVIQKGEYSATFMPGRGMNFVSLKKGEVEAIDQSTKTLFEERYAGLGPMIGPHFHRQKQPPKVKEPSRFPHLAYTSGDDPFSHGIGRYAPWTVEQVADEEVHAILKGDDSWNGALLKDLEGQDFTMHYHAKITDEGLQIELAVRGETETVIGLHTYYALANGKGVVRARVRGHYNDQGEVKPIPSTWNYGEGRILTYPLTEPADYGFQPDPDPFHCTMELETETHGVRVQYWCENEENSIQLWHPEGAPFVCMEPLSAKEPRKPRLTVSQLKILISVL